VPQKTGTGSVYFSQQAGVWQKPLASERAHALLTEAQQSSKKLGKNAKTLLNLKCFLTKTDSFIAQNINFVWKHPQIIKVLLIFLVNVQLFCFGIKRIFGKKSSVCSYFLTYLNMILKKKGIRLKKFFGLLGNFACCFALCFKLSTRCIFTRFLRRETERVHSSCFFCYWCLLGKYHSCMKGRRHSATGCLQRSRHGSSFFLFSLLTFTQLINFVLV
jgi:hypothetical protein